MRLLLAISVLTIATAVQASRFVVVVHTTDQQVRRFICPSRVESNARNAVRTVVERHGSYSWRPLGGKPPYKLIESGCDAIGNVSVTVMDALGQLATGYGVVGVLQYDQLVDCGLPTFARDTVRAPKRVVDQARGRWSSAGEDRPPQPHREAEPRRDTGTTGASPAPRPQREPMPTRTERVPPPPQRSNPVR